MVQGVDVVQSGPPGGLTTLFLRGTNSQHTKVLIDGIPANDPSNASRLFDFSALGLDGVERIEVLRGPQSTLYGSDAIGGVVNIITQRGEGPLSVRASVLGGSYGSHREGLSAGAGNDWGHFFLTGSWLQTEGFSAALSGTEDDGLDLGTIAGRFGLTPTDNFEIDTTIRYIDSRADLDDASFSLGQPPVEDLFRRYLTEQFFTRASARHTALCGMIEQVVAFNLADYQRQDIDDEFPTDFAGQTRKVEYQANVRIMQGNLLTVGADYQAEDATQVGFGATVSATQNDAGVYLQDQIEIGERIYSTLGYRWDDHSAAGPAQTYRVTSLLDVYEVDARLKGSIGTGFRAPSLAENLFPFGNPDLLPETSKGWDYGLEKDLVCGDLVLGATYFRNDIENLILFDLATFTLENIGAAKTHGVELYSVWNVTELFTADITYTRTDTRDLDTGLPLVRRPQHKGSVALTRRLCCDRGSLSVYGIFVGDRLDSRDGSVELEAYEVVNLSGQYQPRDGLRLFFRVNNLFGESYEEITGFQTADLSGFAGVELWR
jgi:vitamin B12 transporter